MIIITAADHNMRDMALQSRAISRAHGHEVITFDLGGLGYGEKMDVPKQLQVKPKDNKHPERRRGRIPCKPDIILNAMARIPLGTPFAWMDADAFAIGPCQKVFDLDFDIAVTLRHASEKAAVRNPDWVVHYGYINAGVMFFRNQPETVYAVGQWKARVMLLESHSDQEAMNTMLLEVNPLDDPETEFLCQGAVIRTVPTWVYNWYYFPKMPEGKALVAHVKTDKRTPEVIDWMNSLTEQK